MPTGNSDAGLTSLPLHRHPMSFEDLILRLELSTDRLNKGLARLETALSQNHPARAEFKNTLRHVNREDNRQLDDLLLKLGVLPEKD